MLAFKHVRECLDVKMLKCLNKNKGATLVEMLVVIAIVAILSLVVFINYNSGGSQLSLSRSASKLAQDIRRAEEMAMSAPQIEGVIPPGYGVEFDTSQPNTYILFADVNDNGKRGGGDPDIEPIIIIESLQVNINKIFANGIEKNNKVWVTFKPPDPSVRFEATDASGAPFSNISIELVANGRTRTITVNKAGLVYVQ